MSNFDRVDTTANRLRAAMTEANKKQADVSREAGIDKGALSSYLKGKYEPKQDVIYKIARVLNVSEMWLWGYDCPKERPIEQKNNDAIADIIIRLRTDEEFMSVVEVLSGLDSDQILSVKSLLTAFVK